MTVDPRSDPLWASLVGRFPSDLFHSSAWMSVLADTYGFEPRADVLVDGSGDAVAGVTFVELDDFIGVRRSTLPFSDFCDPLVADEASWGRLVPEAGSPEQLPWTVRCLRATAPVRDERFELVGKAGWHRIDTTPTEEERWMSIEGSARRAIRKAQRAGLEVRYSNDESSLRRFFELHQSTRRHKYGLLAQPYSFFEAIGERFIEPGQGALMLARLGSELAGGVLFLEYGDTLYYKFNASNPAHLAHRPNDFILWTALEFANSRGLNWVDMGVSDLDQPGLLSYKRKYATEESTVSTMRSPVGWRPDPRAAEAKAVLSDLTDLFVAEGVDDAITGRAGSLLYRYFA